ncbi:MAG: transcriptional regulator, LacI family [Micrococcaceae bacterium]|nr:transcriptional regulator, LacI family [Micrococcaceae bacterium]
MAASTLSEVARLAGVSPATASRVLNGSARTPGAEVADKVRAAAATLGYIANAQAQALATSSTGLLGLIVHDIADPYFSTIARGVQQAARLHGKAVLLASTGGTPAEEQEAVAQFAGRRADAIIVVGTRSTRPEHAQDNAALAAGLQRYCANGGRAAVVGQPLTGAPQIDGLQTVQLPNRELATELAQTLGAMPFREFSLVAGPPGLTTSDVRLEGFQHGLSLAGREPAPVRRTSFDRAGGYAVGLQLGGELAREGGPASGSGAAAGGPVPCIVAVNDVMAIGLIAGLRESGLEVPADVAVAGFDDIETLRDFQPALTTARLPLERIGMLAAEATLSAPQDRPDLEVAGEVMLRFSTGSPVVSPAER